ncbi:unnamed protein product [Cuscuta epithymum]|uniref:DYW domain-containing protein n=1 Tax=Cuscuta epithymum TaxID=186058 RepID=A0AAV0F140_9ASTE|nr:unnamed protein product [Cuscuta epithymum]
MWSVHTPSRPLFCSSSRSIAAPNAAASNHNPLIQSLCKKGHLKQAIHLLSQEPNPTQRTYELLTLSCVHKKSLPDAKNVHSMLNKNGFDRDPFLATKLINMYSELDSISDARQVFDEIPDRTIYVWNALFRALTLAGKGEEVFSLYRQMNSIGVPSDRFTYTYVLKACVTFESSVLQIGKEIHAHILRHGFETQIHIMTTLVDTYARFGCLDYATHVFHMIPDKNVVSWSAMIACYVKNGRPSDALHLFHRMVNHNSNLIPNSVTMVSVLQACGAMAAIEQGKLLHGYVLRNGLDTITPVISALITMYARCGNLETAQSVFDHTDKNDVVLWNSIVSGYGIHGHGPKAVGMFHEMLQKGIPPTPISFISVLGACSHAGLVEEGMVLFESMMKKHGISPSEEHYASVVDLLGRANRLDEASRIIDDMRMEPGPKVWGALLGSCRIHCNVGLAERASQRLFELEPTNAGNYVLLADIYAEAGLWDDVKRVKKLLDSIGLEKLSGCSWIEVRRKMHSITSLDDITPQMKEVQELLVKLYEEMKNDSYPINRTCSLEGDEEGAILLSHSEKLAVGFGLINGSKGEAIRITKNLRLCEDCHTFTKYVSKVTSREIFVRDINRFHHFRDGICSCGEYW